MSVHKFQLTFKSGEALLLTVDMGVNPPRFAATPYGLCNKFPDDYKSWVSEVVMPQVYDLCDYRQLVSLARVGKNAITV